MSEKKELRFAVVGVGYWAGLQIQAWGEVEGAKLVAICNRTVAKAEAFAQRFGIPSVYGNLDEMFTKEKLDFVDIITYPSAHKEAVLAAARHKVPVICQKPMSFDMESCQEMYKACQDAGIPFFIHENFRWQPTQRGVKEILDEGVIGEPFRAHIQLSYGDENTFITEPSLQFYPDTGLTDMGPHAFDLSMFFFGKPQSIYCQSYKVMEFLPSDDIFCSMLRFENLICMCEVSLRVTIRIFIEGKKGTLELGAGDEITIRTNAGVTVRKCPSPHHAWAREFDNNYLGMDCVHSLVQCNRHLFEALRDGKAPETSAEAQMNTMKVIEAARESARSNRVILL